jgi:hypothetical protein
VRESRTPAFSVGFTDLTHEDVRAQLSDYLDDALGEAARHRIDKHLASCSPCRAFLESLRLTVKASASLPPAKAPERVRARLMARIRSEAVRPIGLSIRVDTDPLLATDLAGLLSALADLHARCWLLESGRFDGLADYAAGRGPHLLREANLTISRMRMNSPLNFDLNLNPKSVAESVASGIDSMSQAGARKRLAEIEVEKRELEVADEAAKRVQELEVARRDAQLQQEAERQRIQIEADEAALNQREREVTIAEKVLALETRRIEAETARLRAQQELMKAQLELADQATATAERLVSILRGGSVSPEALPFLTKLLEPPLLQIGLIASTAEINVSVIEEARSFDDA